MIYMYEMQRVTTVYGRVPSSFFRTGNQMFEYAYATVAAIRYKRHMDCSSLHLPGPFTHLPLVKDYTAGVSHFPSANRLTLMKHVLSFRAYVGTRESLMRVWDMPPVPSPTCDIGIHIRLDDVFEAQHAMYVVLPIEWYQTVFQSMDFRKGTVCLFVRPIDDFQHRIVRKILNLLPPTTVLFDSGDVDKDWTAMYGVREFVGSPSSFWFWPVWLSPNLERIHIPNIGLTQMEMRLNAYPDAHFRIWEATGLRTQFDVMQNYHIM